ncbi:unnamed protein product [Rotaria sordida]|uniref:Uncharacterized protein n=1 Tax=Rotaria sordida TaxID=392033 RepID=A0A813RPF1_9BILA|nr:unnamed protein product [Rotaria sordida]CAF0879234.1 unnamed protein product [Rotaria sordida]
MQLNLECLYEEFYSIYPIWKFHLNKNRLIMSTTNVCSFCEERPYDLICTCGDKFDFDCIHQHIEYLGTEIDHNSQVTSDKLYHLNALQESANGNENVNTAQTIIDNWKRKRMQDIDDIAEKALNEVEQRKNTLKDVPLIQENFSKICSSLHQPAHSNLNALIDLQHQIQHMIENYENLPTLIQDDTNLDASLQIKLNPSISHTNNQELRTIDIEPQQFVPNDPIISDTNRLRSPELTNQLTNGTHTVELTNGTHTYELPNEVYTNGLPNDVHTNELPNEVYINELRDEVHTNELPNEIHTKELTSVTYTNDSINDNTNHDEFDAGQTRQIQRINPILISVNNDRYVGAICCHNNQLIYNDYDRITRSSRLTFIPDINDLATKQFINWYQPDASFGSGDNEWIQDITYSNKLSAYLILNRARLRLLKDNTNDLIEFQTFFNRTMKRLSCSDTHIYLVVAPSTITYYGDEIILMNYNKEEQICKTFRDILPSRMNRGAGSLVGEISDLTVISNEQIAIGYRFERRREVGICLLKVLNDGREWSCFKQLLLDDCWHNELPYTPRVDWCAKLNAIILIEYMTGHLIMIDKDGQVTGECRFMHVENHRESPINLSVTNNLLCARFESSIAIHKIIS